MVRQTFSQSLEEKIQARIKLVGDCWIWQPKSTIKYGMFYLNGKTVLAHRAVYEILVGPIPSGFVVDHLCGEKLCVNPKHLEAITQKENVHRAPTSLATINKNKTHCSNGHKFTPENTRYRKDRPGNRDCKTCLKNSQLKYREAHRG